MSGGPRAAARRFLGTWGFSTRVRNRGVARAVLALREEAGSSPTLLDVGCGPAGVGAQLQGWRVFGVDRDDPDWRPDGVRFARADITTLPFAARAFSVVTCVDVVEHLPLAVRRPAIAELARVAEHAVVLACPFGDGARRCDEAYRDDCRQRGLAPPPWLVEHLRQPHPDEATLRSDIAAAAAACGRTATVAASYNEPARLFDLMRRAERRRLLWPLASLSLGLAVPLLPAPPAEASYRVVLSVRLGP